MRIKKQPELITNINGINFYKGSLINSGTSLEQVVMTDDENYRIGSDEDLIKACNRIYKLWY